jgi:hypothetical protein
MNHVFETKMKETERTINDFFDHLENFGHGYSPEEKTIIRNEVQTLFNEAKNKNNIDDIIDVRNIVRAYDLIINGFQKYQIMLGDGTSLSLEKTGHLPRSKNEVFLNQLKSFILGVPISSYLDGLYIQPRDNNREKVKIKSVSKDCACFDNIKFVKFLGSGKDTLTFEITQNEYPRVIKLTLEDEKMLEINKNYNAFDFEKNKQIGKLLYENGFAPQIYCSEICTVNGKYRVEVFITDKLDLVIHEIVPLIISEDGKTIDEKIDLFIKFMNKFMEWANELVSFSAKNGIKANDIYNPTNIMMLKNNPEKFYLIDWGEFTYDNSANVQDQMTNDIQPFVHSMLMNATQKIPNEKHVFQEFQDKLRERNFLAAGINIQ